MEKRRCVVCRKTFTPTGRAPRQRFCGHPECQKERRRRSQKKLRRRDADHRENDQRAQQQWAKKHPGYSKAYRQSHPHYTQKNLLQQHERDAKRRGKGAKKAAMGGGKQANEAASKSIDPVKSGTYELRLANTDVLANEDTIKVEISVISDT